MNHGLFLVTAFGACALALALEVWWLRREAHRVAKEVLLSDDNTTVREPVLTHREPAPSHSRSQEASA
jgi:heme exporter protein CcmD